jgi:hypothetical protein
MRLKVATMMMTMAAAIAVPAAAQTPPRFSVSFDAGADVALSGDVHGGGNGTVLGLPTTVQARTYGDIYGTPFTWAASFGYRFATNTEFRTRVFSTMGTAQKVQVGDVATLPLFAQFDDYSALGLDFGVRQYYGSAAVQPFAGASVGFVSVDEIKSTFTVPAASVTLADVPMYGKSTVLTFALSGGVFIPLGSNFGIQGGVDFRWIDDLKPVDGLAGTGLEPINDKSRRWSMPVTVGAVIRF